MPQLNKFTFNICSLSSVYYEINLPSNENIQKTFRDFNNKEIIYWVDYFPGQIFNCVRGVSLYDERPFEHEFFLRIAESFSLMKELFVRHQKQQINKPFGKSKNLSIVKYAYLKRLVMNNTCI